MGNPDSSLTVSTSDNNDYRGSSCSGGMDLDVGLYRQRSSKGAVKRRRRDSSPPTTAYPYDEKLKAEHPPDSTATKLPKVGQKFKSCDAFERACANGTPEDSEWRLSNAYESESAIEKRCRHAKGFCTGDNFRVRAEAQSNGLW